VESVQTMLGYRLDPETRVADEHFALVFAPRRVRARVPEASVNVVESAAAARAGAEPGRNVFAARVIGPARSSEGLRLYYIMEWLD
jgi:hypothetical protein